MFFPKSEVRWYTVVSISGTVMLKPQAKKDEKDADRILPDLNVEPIALHSREIEEGDHIQLQITTWRFLRNTVATYYNVLMRIPRHDIELQAQRRAEAALRRAS